MGIELLEGLEERLLSSGYIKDEESFIIGDYYWYKSYDMADGGVMVIEFVVYDWREGSLTEFTNGDEFGITINIKVEREMYSPYVISYDIAKGDIEGGKVDLDVILERGKVFYKYVREFFDN